MIAIYRYIEKNKVLLFVLLGVHLFFLINLRFTAWPEMFSYAYLKNNGFLLYKDIIHPYPPLLTLTLSYVYKLFGYDLAVLQIVSWLIILASSILVFLISQKITKNDNVALFTLGIYVLLQPFLEGNMLWFDIAIVLPILAGAFFALRWIDKDGNQKLNIFLVGLFFGVASLIKQTAGIFWVAFFVFLIFRKAKKSEFLHLLAGPIILWGIFLGRIIQENQLVEFWNWTIFYPLFKWSDFPGYVQMALSLRELATLGIFLIPVILYVLWKHTIKDEKFWLLVLFLIAGLVAIYPRFSYFHFQPSLVFFVLLYGYIAQGLNLQQKAICTFLFFSFLFPLVYKPALILEWQREPRFYGGQEREFANLLKVKIGDKKTVFLFGIPSQFYSMTKTFPPKPWTDNFGWYLEIPGVQEMVIERWSNPPVGGPPDFIFWRTPSPGNWFDLGTYQPQKIAQWIKENYTKKEEFSPSIWLWERKLVLSD